MFTKAGLHVFFSAIKSFNCYQYSELFLFVFFAPSYGQARGS